ncbi:MAG: NADH-quinone oxidoreductase subunit G [Gammaproteobacteria bacterium]|nr:NADH-quinone oxidoreductase subunit G [Gammaproteobacteria bacterium]
MADEQVTLEIDGIAVKAKKGEMLIRVTDAQGVYVPRFCYHDKLAVAANCRMCLVEVEKAPKPMPACATPVAEGMKVFTKSPRAIGAQRATMEFLLINHPLDCPICDQGGECELQDLAVGFGRDYSRYNEGKRVVADENLGPLIATDMTRCIHCTRCIRFTEEIAGVQELGMVFRGEHMRVRTYIERTVNHELSGNVIDLCPVGALVSKPYRFSARAWEMTAVPLISPHDPVGSNLFAHVLRGRLMRVVPRENEAINEVWLSDRDRFSYEGIYSADRLQRPRLRRGAEWVESDWETALAAVAEGLRARAPELGVLASSSATLEELYLAGRLARGLGSPDVDHRLRQRDFRDQEADPVFPGLGMHLAAVPALDSLLIIGSNLRREAPLLAHRVRQAARRGARVTLLNPAAFSYHFPLQGNLIVPPSAWVDELAALLKVLSEAQSAPVPGHLVEVVHAARPGEGHRALAAQLTGGSGRAVWLGALAARHPRFADLRALAAAIAAASGAQLGRITEGANAAGAYLAGAVPHRGVGAQALARPGRHARAMLEEPLRAYLLLGGIEPSLDAAAPEALRTLGGAEFVVAVTPYASPELENVAQVLLPMGSFAESSGTYVNCEGTWQSQGGAVPPLGESRPLWKILRVLGTLLGLPDFEYQSSEEIREEVRRACAQLPAGGYRGSHRVAATAPAPEPLPDVQLYQCDALVRRAAALQKTREARTPAVSY